jgi:hypothetical protein
METVKLSEVNFTLSEHDALSLKIDRALALADVLRLAVEGGDPEPDSMENCTAMLYEKLFSIKKIWTEATSRQADA